MRNVFLIVALVGFAHMSAAETFRVVVPKSSDEIIADMATSTEADRVKLLGQALADRPARTDTEVKHLVETLKNHSIAPYAQMAISKSTNPALGASLHESLRALTGDLRHMTAEQLKAGPSPEWKETEERAANIAAIIHALGVMKHQAAAPDLRELLSYDDALNGAVAYAASQALSSMGDEQGLSMMLDKVGPSKPLAISGFGTRGIRAILKKIDAVDATTKANPLVFGDPRHEQITNLADVLGGIRSKDPAVKNAMRQLLAHKYKRVQWGASEALSHTIDPQDKDISRELLRHKDPFVRQRGLDSLRISKTWDKTFLPVLIDLIQHDPSEEVRGAAARTLSMLPPVVPRQELTEAKPALQAALKDKSFGVRYEAFEALRIITGRFIPYEGITDTQKMRMQREPPDRYNK